MVLIHAAGLDLTYWDAQISALSEEHDVVAFDLPGHGLTPGGPDDWAMGRLTDIVAQVTAATGADRYHVAGVSLGGMIAQACALARPAQVALARDATQGRHQASRQLTDDDIRTLFAGLGDLRDVLRRAEPCEKAAIYAQLGLKVTFQHGQNKFRAEVTVVPERFGTCTQQYGDTGRVRGGTRNLRT